MQTQNLSEVNCQMRIFTSQSVTKETATLSIETANNSKKTAKPFVFDKRWAAVFWLIVWQFASMLLGNDLLLPSPIAVLVEMCRLLFTLHFWSVSAASLLRICIGFLLGLVVGTLLAVLTESSGTLKTIVALPMAVSYTHLFPRDIA